MRRSYYGTVIVNHTQCIQYGTIVKCLGLTGDPDFKVTTFILDRQHEAVCAPSLSPNYNDLDAPLTCFSRSRHFLVKRVTNGEC